MTEFFMRSILSENLSKYEIMYNISHVHLDNQFLEDDLRNDSCCLIIIVTDLVLIIMSFVTSSLRQLPDFSRLEMKQQAIA